MKNKKTEIMKRVTQKYPIVHCIGCNITYEMKSYSHCPYCDDRLKSGEGQIIYYIND